MKKLRELFFQFKEILLYGIFGCGTTLINIITFFLFHQVLKIGLVIGNIMAWILAFLFAFITNKLWVFESKEWRGRKAAMEMLNFLVARLATLVLDTFLMWLLVEAIRMDSLLAKIIVNFVVIVANYIASKMWVFKGSQ